MSSPPLLQNIWEYFGREMSLWRSPAFLYSAAFSFLLLYISTLINTAAGLYATEHASAPVADFLLDRIPRMDTGYIHGKLAGMAKDFSLLLLLFLPRYLPFAMKSIAFLTIVRAMFINMTNLGIYPDAMPINSFATFGGDLFFSGHVAFSYLKGLIFWDKKWLRYLFFFLSVLFGASALLGHYHYSIDVFAAPFIAYGIFVISKKVFADDLALLHKIPLSTK